ncbi:Zn-dependent alcohol dehydrogenase [Blautia schinkii]|nr:Zn-dependent alcohol dehydrogenase [Blautia schinkii]
MKAAVLYGKEDLRLEERPIPQINDNEVLVKVKSAAICGTDVRMFRNGADGIDEAHPLIIGHELAGDIEKVGSNVAFYRPGMRVAIAPNMGCGICEDCIRGNSHMCREYRALGISLDGGFAEYVKIPEIAVRSGCIIPMENHVSYAEAALSEPLSCVYNGISQCRIKPGDFVLVVGAGPIGIMHCMMAKMSGAAKVIINDVSQERLDYCTSLQPYLIPVSENVEEEIKRLTNGHGADVVITACPVPSVQQAALRMAANYGRVCFFGGIPKDREEVPLNSNMIHYKQLIVTGSTRASLYQFKQALGFVSAGIIDVKKLITAEFPIDDIEKGFSCAIGAKGMKNLINF